MNKFISNILVGSICLTIAFGGYVKVPKNEKMKHKIEPAQTSHANYFHGSTPIVMPNTRNSGSFAVVDSSTNGYGLVSQNTRPLHVDLDEGYWFTAYRQYVGELTTHGQIGAAFSEDGVEWDTYTNLNYNGNPPWGGGGVGGTGVAQGRYPSALGTEDQPVAIWNENTADTTTGSCMVVGHTMLMMNLDGLVVLSLILLILIFFGPLQIKIFGLVLQLCLLMKIWICLL